MNLRGSLLFWTDLVIALTFLAMIATGSILRWVLPPGSGGGGAHAGAGLGRGFRGGRGPLTVQSFWDMTRHEWGDVHFWIAIALVGMVLLHLALHWGWIKASTWRCLIRPVLPPRWRAA
jgi:hypothetical protein